MNTAEALKLLQLTTPTTTNALKTAYRRFSKLEHPDLSKHPQAKERFARVNEAYLLLKDDTTIIEQEIVTVTHTEEGDELAKLGRGLGPTTNGVACSECHGVGYRTVHQLDKACPDCRTNFSFGPLFHHSRIGGRYEYKCQKCNGTGEFSKNGRKVGVCYPCNGTGWHVEKSWTNRCQTCHGLMLVMSKHIECYTCTKCEGVGELPMWNPVLPRGLLMGNGG